MYPQGRLKTFLEPGEKERIRSLDQYLGAKVGWIGISIFSEL